MLRMGKKPVDLSEMYVAYKAYQGKADKYVRMHGNMPFSPGGEGTDVLDVIRMYGAMPQEGVIGAYWQRNGQRPRRTAQSVVRLCKERSRIQSHTRGLEKRFRRHTGPLSGRTSFRIHVSGQEVHAADFCRQGCRYKSVGLYVFHVLDL